MTGQELHEWYAALLAAGTDWRDAWNQLAAEIQQDTDNQIAQAIMRREKAEAGRRNSR
jgi:hypothetical protein